MMTLAIFDLDGTLADTLADLAASVNYGLRVLGCPEHDNDSYRYFVGNGAMKLCERALPDGRKDDAAKLHELFGGYYTGHLLDNTVIYDGIKEVLDALSSNGVIIAVATNKPQAAARQLIGELLPEAPFIRVLGGCAERPRKPDPAVIKEILAAAPECDKVYMIGDSNVDIQTARNAGCISIGCQWGFRTREELIAEGADHIAEAPGDIADIILRNH
ncbi:MAG: HAD family hydrolase [Ruminococcus sp.]|nr:HAD family hydrolase [Ruminococcus sp.]